MDSPLERYADQSLDITNMPRLIGGRKRDSPSFTTGTRSAADPVNIIGRIVR